MKKIMTYIMAGCMALSMNSCLDLEPTSELVDNNFWKNKEQFSAFNVGLQGLFRQKGYQLIELGEMRSNIYYGAPFSGESSSGYREMYYNLINAANPVISDFAGFYTTINQINLMIDKCNETSLLSDAEKNKYLGNAYGMRAFFYLQLLKSYGKAVINTVHTEGGTLDLNNTAREESSAEEVMAQIKKDIQASEDAYNGDWAFNDSKNGWSLAATKMLKGDAYLWSGKQIETDETKQKDDYRAAKQAYQDIIDSKDVTKLALLDNYKDVFAFSNKCNDEIIFALYNGENETALWNGQYSNTLVMNQQNMGSYGLYDYDADDYVWFDESDMAKSSGVMRVSLNKELYDGENFASRLFRDGDTRFLGSMREVYNSNWAYVGVIANKFRGTMLTGKATTSFYDDQPIYRYSECLLGLAEAKVLLGEDPAEEINEVRKRAYGEEYFAAHPEVQYPNDTDADFYTDDNPFVGSDEDAEEAILKERCREFLFEGKRWYDIRLFNKATKYSVANESRLYWPIDQNALGENSKLKQTDGY